MKRFIVRNLDTGEHRVRDASQARVAIQEVMKGNLFNTAVSTTKPRVVCNIMVEFVAELIQAVQADEIPGGEGQAPHYRILKREYMTRDELTSSDPGWQDLKEVKRHYQERMRSWRTKYSKQGV